MDKKFSIMWFEPIFFLFFGLFHLHRIWAFVDRNSYSAFWLDVMNNRDLFYFALMGIMSLLCIAGIVVFFRSRGQRFWWRWFYIFGGGYVLFDLFAIATGLSMWKRLLFWMFDTSNEYWNIVWGSFIGLGLLSFGIGVFLQRNRE